MPRRCGRSGWSGRQPGSDGNRLPAAEWGHPVMPRAGRVGGGDHRERFLSSKRHGRILAEPASPKEFLRPTGPDQRPNTIWQRDSGRGQEFGSTARPWPRKRGGERGNKASPLARGGTFRRLSSRRRPVRRPHEGPAIHGRTKKVSRQHGDRTKMGRSSARALATGWGHSTVRPSFQGSSTGRTPSCSRPHRRPQHAVPVGGEKMWPADSGG